MEPAAQGLHIGEFVIGYDVAVLVPLRLFPSVIDIHICPAVVDQPFVDQTILEALIEAGANPPYSCMDGACMACLGKVQEGRVYQEDPGILSDDNVANCETQCGGQLDRRRRGIDGRC